MSDVIDIPIVRAKRCGATQLKIPCPYCRTRWGKPRFHYHGLASGHRVAHCCPQHLPPELRGKSLGYEIIWAEDPATVAPPLAPDGHEVPACNGEVAES